MWQLSPLRYLDGVLVVVVLVEDAEIVVDSLLVDSAEEIADTSP
jgi:hypothetical protein